jgi:hypothetical protein
MNKVVTILIAGILSLAPVFALADDQTPSTYTKEEQAKLKKEADAKKAAMAKMTPEEKAAAKKAKNAQTRQYENTTEKITQNPGESRNMGINKSAEASKSGPTPQRDYINTPEAEQKMLKQKGQ